MGPGRTPSSLCSRIDWNARVSPPLSFTSQVLVCTVVAFETVYLRSPKISKLSARSSQLTERTTLQQKLHRHSGSSEPIPASSSFRIDPLFQPPLTSRVA